MTEDLTARTRAAMPFADHLDLDIDSADSERVVGSAPWRPQHCTLGGVLHGGYLMGLADCTAAVLTSLLLPAEATGTTTIEAKTNFFKAVPDGSVTITAIPVHIGQSTVVVQVDLTDERNRLVARSIQTQLVLR